jgi:uncharacterized protein
MPDGIATAAIRSALESTSADGRLQLGFFGGEPLLEAERILQWMSLARAEAARRDISVTFDLTTNGTIDTASAWQVLLDRDMRVCVSCDGDPVAHDQHRRTAGGEGSSAQVYETLHRLSDQGKDFAVVTVVRPDSLATLPGSVAFLHELGVGEINLSLDLWTRWTRSDLEVLRGALRLTADYWKASLPRLAINWFDQKLGAFLTVPDEQPSARCGFGVGEIAVGPSGNLYPCERLIGEDRPDNPMKLFGHVSGVRDFLNIPNAPERGHTVCNGCSLSNACNTSCRCSNYVRTGDVSKPDGLLCALDRICAEQVRRVFAPPPVRSAVL